jgi:hypothetical protein
LDGRELRFALNSRQATEVGTGERCASLLVNSFDGVAGLSSKLVPVGSRLKPRYCASFPSTVRPSTGQVNSASVTVVLSPGTNAESIARTVLSEIRGVVELDRSLTSRFAHPSRWPTGALLQEIQPIQSDAPLAAAMTLPTTQLLLQ